MRRRHRALPRYETVAVQRSVLAVFRLMHTLKVPTPSGLSAHRRILAVFNPVAGGDRRMSFDRVVAALRGHGCAVTVVETTGPGHAEAIARDASADEFEIVAAAGGDGTINEVV